MGVVIPFYDYFFNNNILLYFRGVYFLVRHSCVSFMKERERAIKSVNILRIFYEHK